MCEKVNAEKVVLILGVHFESQEYSMCTRIT